MRVDSDSVNRESSPAIPIEAARDQLERILGSELFNRSERLNCFLRFVVEQTLDGKGEGLKEQVVAAEAYGKREGFNAAIDTAVRNDARRLRDKLREYYETFPDDPITISLPKGGYTPKFERRHIDSATSVTVPVPSRTMPPVMAKSRWQFSRSLAVVGLVVVATMSAAWFSQNHMHDVENAVWPVVPVSSLPGSEGGPTLSPDGNFVAFKWYGADNSRLKADLLVKEVGREETRVLATTPESGFAAWSPDGTQIAFARDGDGIVVVSPLGGPERRVSESGWSPNWTPDSRSLVMTDLIAGGRTAIFEISLDTLRRRQITQPVSGLGDTFPAVSPDGRALAFVRFERSNVGNVYVVAIQGGNPQRRTNWNAAHQKVVWSLDGRELIYDFGYGYPLSMWRVPAFGVRPEAGFQINVSSNAMSPALSRPTPGQPARLAFVTVSADISVRLIDLAVHAPGRAFESVGRLFDATVVDYPGSFSVDGGRIAFTSHRGERAPGTFFAGGQLWVGGRDGTGLTQVTKFVAPAQHPSWSPDGRRLAFQATVEGNTDIFLVSVNGGQPERLTFDPAWDELPSWSQDGRSIYFSSNRTGRPEIWKVSPQGGDPVQITRNGGTEPIESMDGGSIIYLEPELTNLETAKLKQIAVTGGPETVILPAVMPAHWAVTEKGIFFLSRQLESDSVNLYSPRDGQITQLGRLPFQVTPIGGIGRFTVSRDGRWALTVQEDRWERDVAIIENFQ